MTTRSIVSIPVGGLRLEGALEVPPRATGVVAFAHGSGSGRLSPRNRYVAHELQRRGIATLLLDLLTEAEADRIEYRFDIALLAARLAGTLRWLEGERRAAGLPLGLFGASTGAAAALRVAAAAGERVAAVVSRGGRADLAGSETLARVRAPTLLIVGGNDPGVIELNELALGVLACRKSLRVVAGATHLFEEPGALEEVARLAASWFLEHFALHPHPA